MTKNTIDVIDRLNSSVKNVCGHNIIQMNKSCLTDSSVSSWFGGKWAKVKPTDNNFRIKVYEWADFECIRDILGHTSYGKIGHIGFKYEKNHQPKWSQQLELWRSFMAKNKNLSSISSKDQPRRKNDHNSAAAAEVESSSDNEGEDSDHLDFFDDSSTNSKTSTLSFSSSRSCGSN